MKDLRLKLTENEKLAHQIIGENATGLPLNMQEHAIENILERERASKFNSELDKIADQYQEKKNKIQQTAETLGDDIMEIEIKPMLGRLLIEPFAQNPFQRVKIESGIIVDAGGYTPHAELNPITGRYEEQEEFIKTGAVQEVGPGVKYVQPGDVVYYRKDTVVPVPFFKQGLVSLAESQVIAIVNKKLQERFDNIK